MVVSGQIAVEGEKSPNYAGTGISFVGDRRTYNFFLRRGLNFSLTLQPDRYIVYPDTNDQFFVKSIRSEGRELLEEGLRVSGPGKVNLEITMATDTGAVEATVVDGDDKPSAGATAVLANSARGPAATIVSVSAPQSGQLLSADASDTGLSLSNPAAVGFVVLNAGATQSARLTLRSPASGFRL